MDKSISLKIKKSDIEKTGVVRVNEEVLKKLGVADGERVVISKDEQMVLRKAFGDKSVKKDEIFLRLDAREKLGIKEGDKVKVEDYETLGEDIKEKAGDIKEKIKDRGKEVKEDASEMNKDIKEKAEDIKEKIKKEGEED